MLENHSFKIGPEEKNDTCPNGVRPGSQATFVTKPQANRVVFFSEDILSLMFHKTSHPRHSKPLGANRNGYVYRNLPKIKKQLQ